jgi:hypothetical protein
LHAEVARAIALADFVNWDDAWMLETGRRFGFAPKTFQMRFGSPMAKTDDFERHRAVQAFLAGSINHTLTTASDFFLDFVIAKVSKNSWLSRGFLPVRCPHAIVATGVIRLR